MSSIQDTFVLRCSGTTVHRRLSFSSRFLLCLPFLLGDHTSPAMLPLNLCHCKVPPLFMPFCGNQDGPITRPAILKGQWMQCSSASQKLSPPITKDSHLLCLILMFSWFYLSHVKFITPDQSEKHVDSGMRRKVLGRGKAFFFCQLNLVSAQSHRL